MSKYEVIKTVFKIIQFVIFFALFLEMILIHRSLHSLNSWIIIGYLVSISAVIAVTSLTTRLYTWFPYLQKGSKLAITVIIMSAFAFDDKIISFRTIIVFVLMGISILFLIISIFFSQEDKINEIIISREFEKQIKSNITAGSQMKRYNLEEVGIKEGKNEENVRVENQKDLTINTSVDNKTKSYLF